MLQAFAIAIALAGCVGSSLIGGAAITGAKAAIDPKAPQAQTEKSCKEWECFDGYACGPCPGNELPEDE